jgi:DnaJ-domain-containing protein 1
MRGRFRRNLNRRGGFRRDFSWPSGFVSLGGQVTRLYFDHSGPFIIGIVGGIYYRIPVQLNEHGSGPSDSTHDSYVSKSPAKIDPYEVLGISRSATKDEISKAYRSKAREHHPDKVAHMTPEHQAFAEQKMKEINEAYNSLKSLNP